MENSQNTHIDQILQKGYRAAFDTYGYDTLVYDHIPPHQRQYYIAYEMDYDQLSALPNTLHATYWHNGIIMANVGILHVPAQWLVHDTPKVGPELGDLSRDEIETLDQLFCEYENEEQEFEEVWDYIRKVFARHMNS